MLVLAAGACSAGPTGSPTATATQPAPQTLNVRQIPAPSLAGNLLGEPDEREVWIYLPPQYFESEEALPVATTSPASARP